jgi:uncharacterized protein (TIGR02996 family)
MREAFEQAIVDNPDDPSSYAAYGDWLAEQGDPRGEFIQVQLALGDPACRDSQRKEMQAREGELLAAHQEEWLGPLAAFLPPGGMGPEIAEHLASVGPPPVRFVRGLLHTLHLDVLTVPFARTLRDAPQTRLLRELIIERLNPEDEEPYEPGEDVPADIRISESPGIYPLLGPVSFPCLRHLRIGDERDMEAHWPDRYISHYVYFCAPLAGLIEKMPRLEELHLLCKEYDPAPLCSLKTLSHLRVLRIYHLGARRPSAHRGYYYPYPLHRLAANPALQNLTHLLLHPHQEESGLDENYQPLRQSFLPLEEVQSLLASGHLKKLTHLQLRLSDMGDEGCRAIVESGILRRLKWLDLRYGCITDEGAHLLAGCADLNNLDYLDVGRNALTQDGINALEASGINLRADDQLTPEELAERVYLLEGDIE